MARTLSEEEEEEEKEEEQEEEEEEEQEQEQDTGGEPITAENLFHLIFTDD